METPQFKLIIFSRYTASQAATRVRLHQYVPALQDAGFNVEIFPILDDEAIAGRSSSFNMLFLRIKSVVRVIIKLLRERKSSSFFHIYIELFPWLPFFLERSLLLLAGKRKYCVELDDAWFHRYENHPSSFIRFLLGKKIDRIMQLSSLVIAGNQYIADRAISVGARNVKVVPTVVDIQRYWPETSYSRQKKIAIKSSVQDRTRNLTLPTIGWIGSPATTKYLLGIEGAIRRISAADIAQFIAIGADARQLKGLPVKVIPWNESTEVGALYNFDVGIMPLPDSLFERGKCGYKLIQYMACGLPVVASPVGVNTTIVTHGETGYLAITQEDWFTYLSQLCVSQSLRQEFGQAGLARAEQFYSLKVTAPKLVSILRSTFIDT